MGPHLQELRYNPTFNVSFRINVTLYLHTRKCISINWIVTVEERIKGVLLKKQSLLVLK